MHVIELQDNTYRMLQQWARPFEDTPDLAIRRLLEAAEKSREGSCCIDVPGVLGNGNVRRASPLQENEMLRNACDQLKTDLVADLKARTGDALTRLERNRVARSQHSLRRSPYGPRGKEVFAYLLKQPQMPRELPRGERGRMRIECDEELAQKAGVANLVEWSKKNWHFPGKTACYFVIPCNEQRRDEEAYQRVLDILVKLWRAC